MNTSSIEKRSCRALDDANTVCFERFGMSLAVNFRDPPSMITWRRSPNSDTRQRSMFSLSRSAAALRLVDDELEQVSGLPLLIPLGVPFRHQLARDHQAEPIALLGFFEIVRGHQNRRAGIGQPG